MVPPQLNNRLGFINPGLTLRPYFVGYIPLHSPEKLALYMESVPPMNRFLVPEIAIEKWELHEAPNMQDGAPQL